MWCILSGQRRHITLSFLPVGHTKFFPDAGFRMFKRTFKRIHLLKFITVYQDVICMHMVDFCRASTYVLLSFVMLPGIFILDSMDNSSLMESTLHETSYPLLTSLEERHLHDSISSPLSDANTDNNDSQHFELPNLENNPKLFEPLYSGSKFILWSFCSIMQFCMMHKLSYTAIGELLKLLQVLCPIPNQLPTTVFKLKKKFNQFIMSYNYSNLCSNCGTNPIVVQRRITTIVIIQCIILI